MDLYLKVIAFLLWTPENVRVIIQISWTSFETETNVEKRMKLSHLWKLKQSISVEQFSLFNDFYTL